MFEFLVAPVMFAYITIEDETGKMPYPSRVKDIDKVYMYDWADSELPVLVLPAPILDSNSNVVPVGNYQVKISNDNEEMIFLEGGNKVAKISILKSLTLPVKAEIPQVKAEFQRGGRILITLKKDNIEFYSIVYINYGSSATLIDNNKYFYFCFKNLNC